MERPIAARFAKKLGTNTVRTKMDTKWPKARWTQQICGTGTETCQCISTSADDSFLLTADIIRGNLIPFHLKLNFVISTNL